MKITKSQLKQIIKEELGEVLDEDFLNENRDQQALLVKLIQPGSGLMYKLSQAASGLPDMVHREVIPSIGNIMTVLRKYAQTLL